MMEIQSESYFVIMRMSGTERLFYCQKNGLVWLPNAEEAIRFCREEDAKRIMSVVGASGLFAKVVECHSKSTEISDTSNHTNQAQFAGQFNEPIPIGVYWDQLHSIFINKYHNQMSPQFHELWKERVDEFPPLPV